MRLLSGTLPSEQNGPWEDLALFDNDRVLMWTTTHESDGTAYGSETELRRLGIKSQPARPLLSMLAEPLLQSAQSDILRLAAK
jgi:hypothetical protein